MQSWLKSQKFELKVITFNDNGHVTYFCFKLQELTMGHTLRLAFQTLGVVYSDVGTSPLYVFSGVFSKAPIRGEKDVLGALSLILYTLTLIPLIKYAFIVLQANDNGEG